MAQFYNPGPKGEQGPIGVSFHLLGSLDNQSQLSSISNPQENDAYIALDTGNLHVYDIHYHQWINIGKIVGPAGRDGTDGFSAYQLAVQNGFNGSLTSWMNSLIGAKGDKGDTGEKGDKGETGDRGLTGLQGPQGLKGDKGDTGNTGPKGDTGATGPQGVKGDTGATGAMGQKGDPGPMGPTGNDGFFYLKPGLPATKNAVGNFGEICIDTVNGIMYVCVAHNLWMKNTLSSANFTNSGGFA